MNLTGGGGGAVYRGMMQTSQQHVAPCVTGVEWGLGTRGLRMVADNTQSRVKQETGVVPRRRRAAIGTLF